MREKDDLRATFFQEAEELLEQLVDGLEHMSRSPAEPEMVDALFRTVHSIKGGAAAFALDAVVGFSHAFEGALDALRAGRIEADTACIGVLTRASDHLSALLEAARSDDPATVPETPAALEALQTLTRQAGGGTAPGDAPDFQPIVLDLEDLEPPPQGPLVVRFAPRPDLLASGNEPAFLLRDLCALGPATVRCDLGRLPPFDGLQPEQTYLSWQVALADPVNESDARAVFDFVDGLCRLEIAREGQPQLDLPPEARAPAPRQAPAAAAAASAATPAAATDAPASRAALSDAPASAPAADPARAVNGGRSAGARVTAARPAANATIRVDLQRIDRMINLVGELVIHQAMLTQALKGDGRRQDSDIDVRLEDLSALTRQIQDSVMAIRAQPLKALFQRMSRIAREAAADTRKQLTLVTEGADTEIDKTVIEKLADPLTHMIRNAVDHGLEPPEARRAAGKPPTGTIRLSAAHKSGRVVMEIADDGAGIDRARVLDIAEARGLVAPNAQLTPAEVDNLIFQPGFTTSTEVTALSGRGVGMDVVKRSIQTLGGRVSIASVPGQGSTFTIVLPLTLAVLDGMTIEVGGQTVVMPISAIVETMRVSPGKIFPLGTEKAVIRIRDAYVPVVDVGFEMGFRGPSHPGAEHVVLLVETADGNRAALLIDRIHDQRQFVIKGLDENYGPVPGVAAATILGDGRIALILDATAIVGTRAAAPAQLQAAE